MLIHHGKSALADPDRHLKIFTGHGDSGVCGTLMYNVMRDIGKVCTGDISPLQRCLKLDSKAEGCYNLVPADWW